ncbi:hypothetical protein HHI36_006011 [Cryptolaemus montrouzieri]|uniref:Secreted protein n=1 Tax=Cryptolaemus montrouzieri TaxID=559131 RepID=A0ABD2NW20_9CUCU
MFRWFILSFLVILFAYCLCVIENRRSPYEDLQPESIEYKYILRRILPPEHVWWRRGTHHDIDPKSPIIVVRP